MTKTQPTATTTATPVPEFNAAVARPVDPQRAADGRTISFEQPGDGVVHCFSATGLFITSRPAG